ncbi:MAG: exodeoxyribonuclease VII large subunit [Campylobacteraceae bacterium]|jgi:exodeoxyribonuclease VII large subunit|nr:exodeoxyribonuclease VII large subunit [Campylobacteraceae bacterium]
MLKPQSVAELNYQVQALLESTFLHVKVQGEVSRPTYHTAGHIYFTLKDAESSISCVMFRGNARGLKFQLEEGMDIIVNGSVSVYAPRGSYQINCVYIELSGEGALAKAYEQLKAKLAKNGYFDNKKRLPKFPSSIAVVTSPTGAAWHDMLQVANKRWPLAKLFLVPSLVQGEGAASSIAQSIVKADLLNCDVIVVGRGGGSIEDLWAFNEEIVAQAIFDAKTPIVSAVGHEIDYVISDFVADLRAPTPSAAMELILPEQNELKQTIDFKMTQFIGMARKILSQKTERLNYLQELYKRDSFKDRIKLQTAQLEALRNLFNNVFQNLLLRKTQILKELIASFGVKISSTINLKENLLKSFQNTYALQEPTKESKEGFAQVVKDSKKTALENINEGDDFELQTPKVKLSVKAFKKTVLNS